MIGMQTNPLVDFLSRVEQERQMRQQAAMQQPPVPAGMPKWAESLDPNDFTGTTRDALLRARGQLAGGGGSDTLAGGDSQFAPSPENMGITDDSTVMAGINQAMAGAPGGVSGGYIAANRLDGAPQRPAQPPKPEPASDMPEGRNGAPGPSQGAGGVNLRKALGPHVGDRGDFLSMARNYRQTGALPGAGRGDPSMSGGGGADRLTGGAAQASPAGGGGGGIFGGNGPGLGYVIGGIGSLLREASGQQGAVNSFVQNYGERHRQALETNQTRQLAVQLGIPEEIAATAPADILKPMIGDAYQRKFAGTEYKYMETPEGIVQLDPTDGQTQLVYESTPQPGNPSLSTLRMPDGSRRTFDLGNPDERAAATQAMKLGAVEDPDTQQQEWNDVVLKYPDGRTQAFNTGTPEGYAAANQALSEGAVPDTGGGAAEGFDDEKDLRKEFTSAAADYASIRDAYGRVKAAAKEPSAAGDVALIFNFMKMLDPASTVRESEYATAANAGGIPQRIRAQWNRALDGQTLSADQRQDFVSRSDDLFKTEKERHKRREKVYRDLATQYGVDPDRVVVDMNDPEQMRDAIGGDGPVTITSDDEYDRLPSGTRFIGPDGQERQKP